jgi:peptidoglycan/xylan/chitin deacetylase (PgdA/CDA1 family)
VSDVLVLSYHAVSETWPAALAVAPDALEAQMRLLLDRGYRPSTVHGAIHVPPAPRTLAVTFDDAYRSVFETAFPILASLGIPATVFVPTDYPGRERAMAWPGIDRWLGGPHEPELVPASWEQLGILAEAGWEIGSHTCSHPWLTRLADADLERELVDSRDRCRERLGACTSLAYPYGDHDDRVVRAAGAAGYASACTVPALLVAGDPLRWPRIGIYRAETALSLRAKLSPAARRVRRTGVGAWTARAAAAAGGRARAAVGR